MESESDPVDDDDEMSSNDDSNQQGSEEESNNSGSESDRTEQGSEGETSGVGSDVTNSDTAESEELAKNIWDVIYDSVSEDEDIEQSFIDAFRSYYELSEALQRDKVFKAVNFSKKKFVEEHLYMNENEGISTAIEFRKRILLPFLQEDGSDEQEIHWTFLNLRARELLQNNEGADLSICFLRAFKELFCTAEQFKTDQTYKEVKKMEGKLLKEDTSMSYNEALQAAITIKRRQILENLPESDDDGNEQ
jgi:uncharacterized membrane protein